MAWAVQKFCTKLERCIFFSNPLFLFSQHCTHAALLASQFSGVFLLHRSHQSQINHIL